MLLAGLFGTNTWTMNDDYNKKNYIDDKTGTFSINVDNNTHHYSHFSNPEHGKINFWGTADQQIDKNSFSRYNFKFTANEQIKNFYCRVENYLFDSSSGNLKTKNKETSYPKDNGSITYCFPYIFEVLKAKNNTKSPSLKLKITKQEKSPPFKSKITKQKKPKPRRWFSLKNMLFTAGITTGAFGLGYLSYKYLWGKK